ncbi:protein of unknown function [Kingella kingae]|nr:protein of unknown function [Kingella kingae]
MLLSPESTVAAVFTQNKFCAAPVRVAKRHLFNENGIRALIINTGNANAGTGASGEQHALQMCAAAAKSAGCLLEQVLPFSTGVILTVADSKNRGRIAQNPPSGLGFGSACDYDHRHRSKSR